MERCERWSRGRNRHTSRFTMKRGRRDEIHRRCDARGNPTRRARGREKGGKIAVRKTEMAGKFGHDNQSTCTYRLSTLAFPKHRTRTYHFLQTRTSWSLLFSKKRIGQAIISTHDQLQPGRNRWEDDDKAGARRWRWIKTHPCERDYVWVGYRRI